MIQRDLGLLIAAPLRRQWPQAMVRRRLRSQPSLGLGLCGMVAILGACASAPARSPPGAHPTIVSLNPCTDAILAEVAEPAQLLAISHYSHDPQSSSMDPAAARRFRSTGGTAEEVAALGPDVVVGSSFMGPATRSALERMGMRVETVGIAATVDESTAQVRSLAKLAGHPERGEALVARIEDAVREQAGAPIEAALWQGGGIVPGKGTLVSDLLQSAGFASYTARRGMAQGDYLSLERIAADPSEVLLVAGSEMGQRHPVLDRIPGMTVARFDPALTWCGGPSIVKAMERLRAVRVRILPGAGRGTTRRVVKGHSRHNPPLVGFSRPLVPVHPALCARYPSPSRGGSA